MKYAIYGAGSLGIIFSAYLSKAGEKFDIIDRDINNVEALNNNGAKVVGTVTFSEKVHAVLDSEVKDKYDIIILMTKQINNKSIITKAAKWLDENGVICTCQNGLPESDVADVIGENRTYGCAIGWGATRLNNGISELTSKPERESMTFSFGSFNGQKGEYFDELKRIFSLMGEVEIEDNLMGARWAKLLINSAFSGMSAVLGDTFGAVAKNKGSRKVVQRIIKECIDVGRAAGIKIAPIQGKDIVKLLDYNGGLKKWISFKIIPIAIKKHNLLKASMLQDIEKGIPCEIDYINGIVCKFGQKYDVPTPFNDKVVEIIHKIELKELKSEFSNVKLFDECF